MRIPVLVVLVLVAVVLIVVAQAPPSTAPTRWTAVASWTGEEFVKTEPFEVSSQDWRVTWKTENPDKEGSYFAAWVHSADDRQTNGVVSLANDPPRTGTGSFRNGPGRYYLEISSAGIEWAVTVEDQR